MKTEKLALVRFATHGGSNFRSDSHEHQWIFDAPEINSILLLQEGRTRFGLRAKHIDSNECVILGNKWTQFPFSEN
jgi:hypothetical protein